jgi:hypothetical protein
LREFTIKPNFSGFLVMFICNHCPYVNAIIKKIVRDCKDLEKLGVHSLAICSNDSLMYPEDSYEKMKSYSKDNNFSFPYLHDPDQKIAKLYGAICTPDFFGFNQNSLLQYRGRLDGSGKNPTTDNLDRDLYNAMKQISQTGQGPKNQHTSIGCSIKWRQNRGG